MMAYSALLEARHIHKAYTRGQEVVTALSDASLRIERASLTAVTGPSGSGKTTLAHILGGLTRPDGGEIIVSGEHISGYSDARLSRYRNKTIGFVFQNFNLLPYYTALENVMIPLMLAGEPKHRRVDTAFHFLNMMGLAHKATARANELSGGERQRVAIARALVNKPKVIVADEPTGSLDSARAKEIMAIFQSLAHQHDVTVIMVTHDLQLAGAADAQIQLRDGRVIRGGVSGTV